MKKILDFFILFLKLVAEIEVEIPLKDKIISFFHSSLFGNKIPIKI
jgi:hypothetical protein